MRHQILDKRSFPQEVCPLKQHTRMQPKEKDPISLQLHDEMISQTGKSLVRVKKRLNNVNMTFQLKPPEDEKMEIWQWEKKIKEMIEYKEHLEFPTVIGIKRERLKKEQSNAEKSASDDKVAEEKRKMHQQMAKLANERLRESRKNKYFGASKYFGVDIVGELRTIPDYNGQNSIYKGSRTLYRKDGRYTRETHSTDVPPWIGPQYYANLDPKLLSKGIAPENISQVPFKSATSSRQRIPPTAQQLREDKTTRRNNLDSWIHRDPGPRYCQTPEVKKELRRKTIEKNKTEREGKEWVDDENSAREEREKFFITDDGESVDISEVSIKPDPQAILERAPPRIVLGGLTRQLLLVEKEDRMRTRAPPSTKAKFARSGPSPTKLKAIAMIKNTTSFLQRADTIAAKVGRHEEGDVDEKFLHRKDHTMGALSAIKGIQDAPTEKSEYAPSIASIETNLDETSASVLSKAQKAVQHSQPAAVVGKHSTADTKAASSKSKKVESSYISGEPEVVLAPNTRELIFASPIKALQKAAADEEKAEEEIRKKRKEDEDRKRRRAIYERRRKEDELRKANESDIQKALSPKNLSLSRRIGPVISQCLNDDTLVYRPSDAKIEELETMVEKIHIERRSASIEELAPSREYKNNVTGSHSDEDESKEAKDEQVGENSALAAISSLLMPKDLYVSYKSALDDTIIDNIYNTLAQEREKDRKKQREMERKRQAALARKIIDEAPAYSKPNEWAVDEIEEEDELESQ